MLLMYMDIKFHKQSFEVYNLLRTLHLATSPRFLGFRLRFSISNHYEEVDGDLGDEDGGEAHGEAHAEARQVGDDARQHLHKPHGHLTGQLTITMVSQSVITITRWAHHPGW